MAYGDKTNAQVHRFRDRVALHVVNAGGKAETVYLDPKVARKIARALNACAKSCTSEPFCGNTFSTVEISE